MLESSGYSQRVISPFGEESGEEELTVLPRHTKVVVTGNNRTKSVLVGLRGVVKKAVGLGGWHWLVLTNGDEVKLQRNALSVIEAPAADEDEEDHNSENFSSSGSDLASGEITRHLKPRSHKLSGSDSGGTIRSRVVNSSHFTGSKSSHRGTLTVNLRKLETAALWRYSRHFHLTEVNLDPSKEQLVKAVERHFVSKVIAGFVHAAKRLKHSVHGLPG